MYKKSTITNGEIVDKVAENLGGIQAHNKQNIVNRADWEQMIATAAYYRTEQCGFANADRFDPFFNLNDKNINE